MKTLRLTLFMVLLFTATKMTAQVPVLNSYPSAAAVLFLDFDGHIVSGTNWNIEGPVYCGPSNLDTAQMTEIYNRVAEDYRPFNINVTTDSATYAAAPIDARMRIVLTITSDWYGKAGGVAYTNSFIWGNNTPCFVFTALHKYKIKNIAEAASHEAGHTLGLRHQAMYDSTCKKITDYNNGAGSGTTGWAPIMGIGYYRNNTTWHYGPNPYGCANEQDDLAIITSNDNGFGYRPDDNAATDFAAAAKLNADTNQLAGTGLISTNKDTDLFGFTMPANGPFILDVHPYSIAANDEGSNLDVEVQLYNKDHELITTYNPVEMLSVAIDTTLARGEYYVAISGASNLFSSNYASLGAYSISGSVPAAAPFLLRTLRLRGNANRTGHQLNWIIDADEKATSQVLERSDNGTLFLPVANLLTDLRSYALTTSKAAQYRLNITFDNGRQYYSNIIALTGNALPKPQLYTTFIRSDAVQVASPAVYTYIITDMAGQPVKKGQVKEGSNTINMGFLKSGLYIISFENGAQRFVEKFIRQ